VGRSSVCKVEQKPAPWQGPVEGFSGAIRQSPHNGWWNLTRTQRLPRRLTSSCRPARGRLQTPPPRRGEGGIDPLLIVRSHGTGARTDRLGREVQVLADMPCVDGERPVARARTSTPSGTDGAPKEDAAAWPMNRCPSVAWATRRGKSGTSHSKRSACSTGRYRYRPGGTPSTAGRRRRSRRRGGRRPRDRAERA